MTKELEPKRVLIGCVAPDDPISERGERPIVTAAWALKPYRVDLIYSPTTEEAYNKTRRYLWMYCSIQNLCPWSLNIHDPTQLTRYEAIIDPLVDVLRKIKESVKDPNVEFHIVESATPAMRTVMMLSAVSKVIDAQVWHVDDPPPGEKSLKSLPANERLEKAKARLTRVNLSRFEGAAIRFFTKIRLHLYVIRTEDKEEEIQCEIIPGHWLTKHDPKGGPMRFLLELCKARTGEYYGVRQSGGWIRPQRLRDGNSPSARTQAIHSINEEVASFALGDRSIKELIQVRGSTKNREYRVSLEPEEILIEYVGSSV